MPTTRTDAPAARAGLATLEQHGEARDMPHDDPLRYRIGLALYAGASAFMIAWTVILVRTLPARYLAGQWRIAWTGFDLALVVMLAAMAWAIWRRRQVALLIMVITATLLLCDAWFDVTLSWGGSEEWTSMLTAFGCEIPLAVAMLLRVRSVIIQTAVVVALRAGVAVEQRTLRGIPLLTTGHDDDAAARERLTSFHVRNSAQRAGQARPFRRTAVRGRCHGARARGLPARLGAR